MLVEPRRVKESIAFTYVLLLALIGGLGVASSARAAEGPSRVELVRVGDAYRLLRNGQPYVIRGAGGDGSLALLAASGGNSIRTWGADSLEPLLDEAQRLGLTVMVGFWIGHERHGFDYADPRQVAAQYERVRAGILRYRNHPAVLAWALGNEMEGFADGGNPRIWATVDSVAALAHELDPAHPTLTVMADIGGKRVESVHRLCPHVDIVGINSYGGAPSLPERWRKAGGTKPYVVTEYGPPGTWEIGRNPWGAVEEPTSGRKAGFYRATFAALAADSTACLGSYAFIWGAKHEATPTWYGLLLPDGTRLAAVDALAEAWSGRAPANRCPEIESFALAGEADVAPGGRVQARLATSDPERDSLTVAWTLACDAMAFETGGETRPAPRLYPDAIVAADARGAELRMPKRPGAYRLSVVVRDGHRGAAVANLPLHVKGAAPLAEAVALPFVVVGDDAVGGYAPSGWMGEASSLTMNPACTDSPHAGAACTRFTYSRLESWCGVVWQDPANDWGDRAGGYDLTGATKLTFWARGAAGGERVKFGLGIIANDKKFWDSAKAEREVVLTPGWKRYEIGLGGKSLARIKSGFWWTLAGQGAPVTFDLDDVRYE